MAKSKGFKSSARSKRKLKRKKIEFKKKEFQFPRKYGQNYLKLLKIIKKICNLKISS